MLGWEALQQGYPHTLGALRSSLPGSGMEELHRLWRRAQRWLTPRLLGLLHDLR